MMWVCTVGDMLWVHAVDDTVYSVGHTSTYILWVICCEQHRYMMWVTWLSTVYTCYPHHILTVYDFIYCG